jgi:hypothetical protein
VELVDAEVLETPNELDDRLLSELERFSEDEENDEFGVELGIPAKLDEAPMIELRDELDDRAALDGVDDILLEDELAIENKDEFESDELERTLLTEDA